MEKKRWLGSDICDFCGDKVSNHKDFYDGVTIHHGSWALMCDQCFIIHGVGRIGVGIGQKYDGRSKEKIGG